MSRIANVDVTGLLPFAHNQKIVFHTQPQNSKLAEVHLITGQNGSGKTRLLSLILAKMGHPIELQDRTETPKDDRSAKKRRTTRNILPKTLSTKNNELPQADMIADRICIAYRSGGTTFLQPFVPMAFPETNDELSRFSKSDKHLYSLCQRLVNHIISAGIASVSGDPDNHSITILSKLSQFVKAITHRDFGFSLLSTQEQETQQTRLLLTANWPNQNMQIHHAPDGLRAVFQLVAAIMMSIEYKLPAEKRHRLFRTPFTLILDEPETFLHPKWQRLILPAMQSLFPFAQIICATHSPFVISSVNEGFIHILRFNDDGKVIIDPPRECSKGDTYQDAVAEVLGLSDPLMDYDPETQQMLEDFEVKRKAVRDTLDYDSLKPHAEAIANRSTRLSYLMGQQMHQLKVQLERSLTKNNA